jgi:hypothetical protein
MKTKLSVLLLSFVICLCAFPTLSQGEEEETSLVYVRENYVKLSMAGQFEEACRELVAHLKKTNHPHPMYTWVSDNLWYAFIPVKNLGDIDTKWDEFNAVMGKMKKDKYQEVLRKWNESIEYQKDYVYRYLPEYSYAPEKPRLKPEEMQYAIWDMMYVIPGKQAEFLETAKKWVSLLKAKKTTEGIDIYVGDMGVDVSMFMGVLYGKDASDFWAHNMKMWQAIGKEGQELFQKLLSLLRKREFRQFWYAPELSYIPGEK